MCKAAFGRSREDLARPATVWVVSYFYPPDFGGGATRAQNLATMTQEQASSVLVVTTFPQYPKGHTWDKRYSGKCLLHETVAGVRTLRLRMPPLPHRGLLNRLIVFSFFTMAAIMSIPLMRKLSRPPDVVIAITPVLFGCIPSYVIAKLYRAKLVLDMPDLWPEQLGVVRGQFTSTLKSLGGLLARWIYKLPDFVTAAGDRSAEELRSKYRISRVAVLYSGVDTARFHPIDKQEARAHLLQANVLPPSMKRSRIVLYSGVIGPSYALFDLVNAIGNFRDRNVVLLLVGDGEDRDELQHHISRIEATNIVLAKPRPREELPKFICAADLCLVPSMSPEVTTYAVPTKFFEYLACGKPVACDSSSGVVTSLVRQLGIGVVVDAGQLGKVLSELSEKELQLMGDKARLAASRFSLDSLSQTMGEIIRRIQ